MEAKNIKNEITELEEIFNEKIDEKKKQMKLSTIGMNEEDSRRLLKEKKDEFDKIVKKKDALEKTYTDMKKKKTQIGDEIQKNDNMLNRANSFLESFTEESVF